jgi:type III restriction enzyme
MSKPFYEQPVLNSPYYLPTRHHALGPEGRPLDHPPIEGRRACGYVAPVPKARKQRQRSGANAQTTLDLEAETDISGQAYGLARIVDEIRQHLVTWRAIPNPADWGVTPSTARLLEYWRNPPEEALRPFFCQIEAVETIIWLSEVARNRRRYAHIWKHLDASNAEANPGLFRLTMKMATGSGKTAVMAMLIAWHTVNAVRSPNSNLFSRGFLIVTPASPSATGFGCSCQPIPRATHRPTGAGRHAARDGQGEDHHHQLPLPRAPPPARHQQGR